MYKYIYIYIYIYQKLSLHWKYTSEPEKAERLERLVGFPRARETQGKPSWALPGLRKPKENPLGLSMGGET